MHGNRPSALLDEIQVRNLGRVAFALVLSLLPPMIYLWPCVAVPAAVLYLVAAAFWRSPLIVCTLVGAACGMIYGLSTEPVFVFLPSFDCVIFALAGTIAGFLLDTARAMISNPRDAWSADGGSDADTALKEALAQAMAEKEAATAARPEAISPNPES